MDPLFFKDSLVFRKWLAKNHDKSSECFVGFYKVKSKKKSMTWSDSVDQAICFGWIDSVRKRIDEESYMIRFTPRKANSIWSAVNINKVSQLKKEGLMEKAGLTAYAKRKESKSKVYAFEQKKVTLADEYKSSFKRNKKAWAWFEKSAPSYRKICIWWVMSAKREDTRLRRLGVLMDCSADGVKIPSQRR